jgi:hypothetical protein
MGRFEGAEFVEQSDLLSSRYFFEEQVKAKVGPKTGPIICVNKIIIVLMDNINIPAHQKHLKAENSWVSTVIRKDKFDCVAVSCPYKLVSKEHMAALVDGPVTGKALTKMRVKTNLVSARPPSTESNQM